jgi:hypothetical protein
MSEPSAGWRLLAGQAMRLVELRTSCVREPSRQYPPAALGERRLGRARRPGWRLLLHHHRGAEWQDAMGHRQAIHGEALPGRGRLAVVKRSGRRGPAALPRAGQSGCRRPMRGAAADAVPVLRIFPRVGPRGPPSVAHLGSWHGRRARRRGHSREALGGGDPVPAACRLVFRGGTPRAGISPGGISARNAVRCRLMRSRRA